MEALFGLLGVVLGSLLIWFKDWRSEVKSRDSNAVYLAARVVWILHKYALDCMNVVHDDGFSEGQRPISGALEPQVKEPANPDYPNDLDWKSISPDLMYRLLSLPSEAEAAARIISGTSYYSYPPDYEEYFEERQFNFAKLGLMALNLEKELREKYHLPNSQSFTSEMLAFFEKKIKETVELREKRTSF